MASSAIALAAVAAKITTIGDARAALGVVSHTLANAYERLPDITTTADLRDTAREYLDQVNSYAQRIYRIWNDDPDLQDEDISTLNASKVGLCISQANKALSDIENLANTEYWDIAEAIEEVLRTVGHVAGATIQAIGNAVAAGGTALFAAAWPTLLVAGLIAGVYYFRKPIFAALKTKAGA
jgi:hypothetical protein